MCAFPSARDDEDGNYVALSDSDFSAGPGDWSNRSRRGSNRSRCCGSGFRPQYDHAFTLKQDRSAR